MEMLANSGGRWQDSARFAACPSDPREQPRCANCGHRRIFHFIGVNPGTRLSKPREIPTRCGVDIDKVIGQKCGCDEYRPVLRSVE